MPSKKISSPKTTSSEYTALVQSIGKLLEQARAKAYSSVNYILVKLYWEIGRMIIDFEQNGRTKAVYGTHLLDNLSIDLKSRFGSGFSRSNVIYMRLLYQKYPKSETVSDRLNWSHYVELLKIDDNIERSFYERECIHSRWSIRDLKRQKSSALFERLALSKNKQEILKLAKEGQQIEKVDDLIKDPYILEFLNIQSQDTYSEHELEQNIIQNLQRFLLELGKGFTFVARQFRITLANRHYYIDLVFYHRILKCFVLIDLKINEVTHADVGQMNMYLNYFKKEEMVSGDNPPLGIILTKEKDKIIAEYALGGISNTMFISKYKLYLPNKKELEAEVQKILKE